MRLIDADFLISEIENHNDIANRGMTWATWQVVELLKNCPLPANDPLTLEELREMDGEPVFIVRMGSDSPEDNAWALVNRENCLCKTSDGRIAFFELYGKTWLAYRRRPEEG